MIRVAVEEGVLHVGDSLTVIDQAIDHLALTHGGDHTVEEVLLAAYQIDVRALERFAHYASLSIGNILLDVDIGQLHILVLIQLQAEFLVILGSLVEQLDGLGHLGFGQCLGEAHLLGTLRLGQSDRFHGFTFGHTLRLDGHTFRGALGLDGFTFGHAPGGDAFRFALALGSLGCTGSFTLCLYYGGFS